ncbi:APC family permease [Embleya sp. NPDC056575]|uniref:APC family permease n=1 Tax=unclassified Embleya TaxID=2699296 RepID=UPI0036B4BFCF
MSIDSTSMAQDLPEVTEEAADGRLRGSLGVPHLLFTLLAYNGPLIGAVAYQPIVIGYGNGVGAPMAFILGGAVLMLFALGFVAMSSGVKQPGGFYSFVAAGLGRRAGMGAAFVAIAGYFVISVSNFSFFGLSVNGLSDRFGWSQEPWWWYAIPLLLFCGVLGYFRIDVSAKVLAILLAAELVIVGVYDTMVVVKGGAHGLSANFLHPDVAFSGSLGVALLFAAMMYGGFEATVVFRHEVKDPDRSIPRATYLFIVGVGIFYALTTWVTVEGLGESGAKAAAAADPSGSVQDTMRRFAGLATVDATSVLLNTSVVAASLALYNVLSRYVFRLAAEGVLPKSLGTPHPVHHSPHRASIATGTALMVGVVVAALVGVDANQFYAQLAGIFSYALFFLFVLTNIAVLVYLNRPPMVQRFSVWRRLIAPVLALVGLSVVLYLGLTNITVLLPVGQAVGNALIAGLYALFVAGFLFAHVIKKRRPEVYAQLGGS